MSTLVVPPLDAEPWPTLGPAVCDFLEERAVFGPGSLKGQPYRLDPEKRAILFRAYEVYPAGHIYAGRRRFRRVGISLRKGTAKCLDPGTLLRMSDGTRRRADQLRAGDEVLSWDGARVVTARVAGVAVQPAGPRRRVVTAAGREIVVSADHPFLVSGTQWRPGMPVRRRYSSCDPARGVLSWSAARDLAPGDRLVPALDYLEDDRPDTVTPEQAWLLGVLVGDCTGDGRLSNTDPEVVERVAGSYLPTPLTHRQVGQWYLRGVRPFLAEHGLTGTNAHHKRVPAAVTQGSRKVALAFLAGLLDTDGCVTYRPLPNGRTRQFAEWYSVNRDLMIEVQDLLASIGANAHLVRSESTYRGEPYVSWKVSVGDTRQLQRLAESLPVTRFRNVANLERIREHRSVAPWADGHLDKVTAVIELPDAQTIAVEIEETHTHVTAGLITHNTELQAAVAYAELHPEGPVRCDGFDAAGNPVGRPVADPYIPLLAYTEEQVEELAYGALYVIVTEGPDAHMFDAGKDRTLRLDYRGRADGKAVPLAGSPSARDGARTTCQMFDESHRLWNPRQLEAYETMMANLEKRPLDDPWSFEVTTAGQPGQGSIAERTYTEAQSIARGEIEDPDLFYLHREAGPGHDLTTIVGRIEAIREATGPVGEFGVGQFNGIARQWDRPGADKAYLERVWLNRWIRQGSQAFDVAQWAANARPAARIEPGAEVTAGFDGARFRDSTGIVITDMATGRQHLWAGWERPTYLPADEQWEIPEDEVTASWEQLQETYRLVVAYCDPPHWTETVGSWEARWPTRFEEWWTTRKRAMAEAVRAYREGIDSGALTHTDHPDMNRHVGNAGRVDVNLYDPDGERLYVLGKIHQDRKFDYCMAGVLSWRAYLDAIKSGRTAEPEAYVPRRIR